MEFTSEEHEINDSIGVKFVTVAGIFTVVVGIVGNVLIICAKGRRGAHPSADSAFKICLATADLCSLIVGMVRHLTWSTTWVDPIHYSAWHCTMIFFLMYSLQYTASWILVALNVERCYVVLFPLAEKRTWRFATGACLTLLVCFCISQNWYFFIIISELDDLRRTRCEIGEDYAVVYRNLFPWFTLTVNCILPTIIFLLICIVVARKIRSRHKTTLSVTQTHTSTMSTMSDSGTQRPLFYLHEEQPSQPSVTARSVAPRRVSDLMLTHEKATLYFLVFMDVTYFLLSSPRDIFMIVDMVKSQNQTMFPTESRRIFGIVSVFAYMNSAFKFYYYLIISPKFRAEVKSVFMKENVDIDDMFTGAEISTLSEKSGRQFHRSKADIKSVASGKKEPPKYHKDISTMSKAEREGMLNITEKGSKTENKPESETQPESEKKPEPERETSSEKDTTETESEKTESN